MKNFSILLTLALILGSCSSNKTLTNGEVAVIELGYGICDMQIVENKFFTDSPSGVHRISTDFEITKNTNNVPCVENQSFGLRYSVVSNVNKEVPINIVWTYPKEIENEQGEKFAQSGYIENIATNKNYHLAYTLDKKYLEAKGNWKVELFHNGNKLYEKKFHLK